MFFDDHNPPHFHAAYGNFAAAFAIDSLKIIEGSLPPRIHGLVIEWALLNQEDLKKNWDCLRKNQKFKKIKPLV